MTPVEPIAIIGIGCRFPGGAGTPESFWDLLSTGREVSGPAPEQRWEWYRRLSPAHDLAVQRSIPRGSFLDDIAGFDAEFFGLSGREAELMDPQQRILLETSWEALEHAGVPPRSLSGSETGVYVGVCTQDYGRRLLEDLPGIEAWTGIGAATCAVADRISYALDLRGPSIAVDTACSSSLVSLHLACQGLRAGDCSTALAAGVNLVVSPGETLSLDAAGALSPDGRSKPFDAGADGYGRGEGCGVLVLRRLADALRAGDRVLAVVVGSGVNQDGRTHGIMAPSGAAQEHVMRRACANAGIDPATVDLVEAHGTGTRLGDPEEAEALSAVYGAGRAPGEPCLIGSVKANIGHLEGAAGVASLIKVVLALHRAEIPPCLVRRLNPDIAWDSNGLRVATEPSSWPTRQHPRRAAVSGFGYGGAIAHVVLEQAPAQVQSTVHDPVGPKLYPLSAGSPEALAEAARRLADRLEDGSVPLSSAGHTLALRRSHLHHRATLVARGREELGERLRALAAEQVADGGTTGQPLRTRGGPVWVFSGHGSQWRGMGRELLVAEPAFRQVIEAVEPIYQAELGFSPRDALRDGDLGDVAQVQSLIFAVQVGLAAVWRWYGVAPSAVIGHSVGEIAAAVACGALSLPDGARLICWRSALLRRVAGRGAMAMIGLPPDEVAQRLSHRHDVVLAIIPSPSSTVVSGDPAAVRDFAEQCRETGAVARDVASDVAFHSPQVEPLLAELRAAAADLVLREPAMPMYRTAVPDPRSPVPLDGDYWSRNLREPVRLRDAVATALSDGHRVFLEVSPHPVVAHSISECAGESADEVFVGWTLRRDRAEVREFLSSLGAAHCHGVQVDWGRVHPSGDLVELPTNPWRHRPHWREPERLIAAGAQGHDVTSRTLLGARTVVVGSDVTTWRTWLDDSSRPYPGSHTINGTEIVPAAVLVGTFLDAGGTTALTGVTMSQPLLTAGRREVQVVRDGERLRLAARVVSGGAEPDDESWLVHAEAEVAEASWDLRAVHAENTPLKRLDPDHVSSRLAAVGVPSTGFEWSVEELSGAPGRLRARIRSTGVGTSWAPVLDAVMTVAPAAFPGEPELRMVVRADSVAVTGAPPEDFVVDAVLDFARPDSVDVVVSTDGGRAVAVASGLRYPVVGAIGGTDQHGAELVAEADVDLPPEQLREHVLREVAAQIAAEMRVAEATVNHRRPLVEQGLDSVMSVMVRRRLERRFRRDLPQTLLWQQPTVLDIADHLVGLLSQDDGHGTRAPSRVRHDSRTGAPRRLPGWHP